MKGEPELPSDSAKAPATPEPQAQHPAETSPNGNPKVYRAKGKIASLRKEERDTLNRLLLNGATYAIDPDKGVSAYVLQFANGRRIHCVSSNPNALAGKSGHVMLDEFALHPDQRLLYRVPNTKQIMDAVERVPTSPSSIIHHPSSESVTHGNRSSSPRFWGYASGPFSVNLPPEPMNSTGQTEWFSQVLASQVCPAHPEIYS